MLPELTLQYHISYVFQCYYIINFIFQKVKKLHCLHLFINQFLPQNPCTTKGPYIPTPYIPTSLHHYPEDRADYPFGVVSATTKGLLRR